MSREWADSFFTQSRDDATMALVEDRSCFDALKEAWAELRRELDEVTEQRRIVSNRAYRTWTIKLVARAKTLRQTQVEYEQSGGNDGLFAALVSAEERLCEHAYNGGKEP